MNVLPTQPFNISYPKNWPTEPSWNWGLDLLVSIKISPWICPHIRVIAEALFPHPDRYPVVLSLTAVKGSCDNPCQRMPSGDWSCLSVRYLRVKTPQLRLGLDLTWNHILAELVLLPYTSINNLQRIPIASSASGEPDLWANCGFQRWQPWCLSIYMLLLQYDSPRWEGCLCLRWVNDCFE